MKARRDGKKLIVVAESARNANPARRFGHRQRGHPEHYARPWVCRPDRVETDFRREAIPKTSSGKICARERDPATLPRWNTEARKKRRLHGCRIRRASEHSARLEKTLPTGRSTAGLHRLAAENPVRRLLHSAIHRVESYRPWAGSPIPSRLSSSGALYLGPLWKVLFFLSGHSRSRKSAKSIWKLQAQKIYVSNHTSFFSTLLPLMMGPWRALSDFVAKNEVHSMPFIGTFLPQDGPSLVRSLRWPIPARDAMQTDGNNSSQRASPFFFVFPEGTFCPRGWRFASFQLGAFNAAAVTGRANRSSFSCWHAASSCATERFCPVLLR